MTPDQRLARIDQIIAEIKAQMERPGLRELTSREMRSRADSIRHMATQIKLQGGQVRKEYE